MTGQRALEALIAIIPKLLDLANELERRGREYPSIDFRVAADEIRASLGECKMGFHAELEALLPSLALPESEKAQDRESLLRRARGIVNDVLAAPTTAQADAIVLEILAASPDRSPAQPETPQSTLPEPQREQSREREGQE